MTHRTVFLFSGQGSQYFQMGADLYRNSGVFRDAMDRMDAIMLEMTGASVVQTLYAGGTKAQLFNDISLTTPALFMVELAVAQTLRAAGIEPALTLGASHGTFAASVVSGCLDMESGLRLAIRHGQIVREAGIEGGMTAVLTSPSFFEGSEWSTQATIASYNFAAHFVVSARSDRLKEFEGFLKTTGHAFQRLPVSYAFHSEWIDSTKEKTLAAETSLLSADATIPMVCAASASQLSRLPSGYFWNLIRQPIQFEKTIHELEKRGPFRYIDLGPSGSLATFLKYLLPKSSRSEIVPVLTPYNRDWSNLTALIAAQ